MEISEIGIAFQVLVLSDVGVTLARSAAFCLCAYVCLCCGCAPFATVEHISASYGETGSLDLANAEKQLAEAGKIERHQPVLALEKDLAAAKIAANALDHQHNRAEALGLYNFAVARGVENLQRARLEPWRHPISLSGSVSVLTAPSPIDSQHDPSSYDLVATDALKLGGKFFRTRSSPEGIGAPLVAVERSENMQFRQRYQLPRVYAPVTAVVKFQRERAQLEFVEPFAANEIKMVNHSFPLAADYDAPMAMLLSREHPEKLGLIRLFRPEKYADTARITRLQPFDPRRTPVIFVHGVYATPATWVPMIRALRRDPEIQRRYQLWVFSYPTGYPYPYSAVLLRHQLDGIARAFPNRKPVILIGHSLGGMICRLVVTDAGDKMWRDFFGKPPDQTPIAGRSRELLQEALVFNHRPEVKRVIFITTPHRGAVNAGNWMGRLVSRLVQTPMFLAELGDSFASFLTVDPAARQLNRMPNSIDTMAPNDRLVREMDKFPIARGVPYHSIIGDRGKGDTPNSTDGVVAYWSSHLDGAASEAIVPTNHSAERTPQAAAEVIRILKAAP